MRSIKNSLNPVSFIILFLFGCVFFQCKPEDEVFDFSFSNGLTFSADTILFDTVFTGVGSTTKRLKVYNQSKQALKISNIQLAGGASSPYKIYVNGIETIQSEDIGILGKDSLLMLIEVFIDPLDKNSPYLVNDSILFETNGISQDIKLIAWGQDANYLGNVVLPCNTNWTNDRPYLIYSSILIDTLCQLTIEPGTKIFGAKDAYIYTKGKIIAEGTPDDRILFQNQRQDPAYENLPGQWGGIVLLEGSHGNSMNFTTIRNAVYGIRLGSPDQDTIPDIVMKNMIIENMSNAGILAFTSDLYAENVLIDNCIEFNCGNIAGGNYTYKHCTFANYGYNFIRQNPSFYIADNIQLDDGSMIVEDIYVTIKNTIIDGNIEDELFFNLDGGAPYTFEFNNSIFKTSITDLDTLGNIINADPKFINSSRYDYRLDTLSPAKDMGIFVGVTSDLDGNARDNFPDIGAYERIE